MEMTIDIRYEQLIAAIKKLPAAKIKQLRSVLDDEINQKYDMWEDEGFLSELDARSNDIKSGVVKGLTWEEVKEKVAFAKK